MLHTFGRDPFARTTRTREVVAVGIGESCAWCGMVRIRGRRATDHDATSPENIRARRTLYRYGVEPDSIGSRHHQDRHLFCSVACRDAHQG